MTRPMKFVLILGLLAIPALASAQSMGSQASADAPIVYVAPFIGTTFSGDTTSSGTAVGVAAGWRGTGWWGVEGEVASTPNFFEQTGFLTSRMVTTAMANVLVHYGSRNMSVFGVAGYGAIHVDLAESGGLFGVKKTEPGFNVGAGAMRTWTRNVGVRGDLRYFRAAGNTDDDGNIFGLEVSKLHFVRASAALVVGF
ncbi:MAG: outer membrane beta-barrel protein [Acidobacteriota bacterium]